MLSGAATTIATQILKLKVIPVPAEKYPRTSAAIVSSLASLVAVFTTNVDLVINSFIGWVAFALGAYLLSAMTYNNILREPPVMPAADEPETVRASDI